MNCGEKNGSECGMMASQPCSEVKMVSEASSLLRGKLCQRLCDSSKTECSAAVQQIMTPAQGRYNSRYQKTVLLTTSPTLKAFVDSRLNSAWFHSDNMIWKEEFLFSPDHLHTRLFCNPLF